MWPVIIHPCIPPPQFAKRLFLKLQPSQTRRILNRHHAKCGIQFTKMHFSNILTLQLFQSLPTYTAYPAASRRQHTIHLSAAPSMPDSTRQNTQSIALRYLQAAVLMYERFIHAAYLPEQLHFWWSAFFIHTPYIYIKGQACMPHSPLPAADSCQKLNCDHFIRPEQANTQTYPIR